VSFTSSTLGVGGRSPPHELLDLALQKPSDPLAVFVVRGEFGEFLGAGRQQHQPRIPSEGKQVRVEFLVSDGNFGDRPAGEQRSENAPASSLAITSRRPTISQWRYFDARTAPAAQGA
jgi:hypothetical protein